MKKQVTVDGNEACSMAAYQFTEVAGIYPITPSSPMAEHCDEWSSKNVKNIFGDKVKVVEMQSEAGAAGFVHGSLQGGCLTTTFTASQGLLLMIPNMYKIAGEMLPCVIHVAARSLATHALSIFGDHQDIYATRQTGFAMISSSSVQDAHYLGAIAHLTAISSSMPFLHFFDGFRTSHEIDKIDVLESDDYKQLLDYEALKKFKEKSLNPYNPNTRGTAQNDDIYFQATEARNKYYEALPDKVNEYMEKLNNIAGTNYKPFNYYGNPNAKKIIIAMGSVCETIKETIDDLKDYGLVEVHLYRPFSKEYLLSEIPDTVEKIAVLDRTKEPGSIGEPLYLDVVAALKDKNIKIVGGRYGLSSKNTTPAQIKAVFEMLENPINDFTIGIEDDVTNKSLKVDENYKIDNSKEFLIYGYGSDGMVSASKSIMKLIGNNTNNYVQGYFQYDSKKSGGVTIGHLRFNEDKIRSTYYVENPSIVVVTKESYLTEFETLNNIKENGIFILNTIKTEQELNETLPQDIKNIIKEKNIKFYTINAYLLARNTGLGNKISTIMEAIILKLSNLVDYDLAKKEMKENAHIRYFKKGEEIVNANYNAIEEAEKYLKEMSIDDTQTNNLNTNYSNIYEAMRMRKGDQLKVSEFLNTKDGIYESGTTQKEKRGVSEIVPFWMNSNCIQCNMCATVCPHGVIRPYILSEEEYNNAPDYVKERCIKEITKQGYYILGISVKDCTGCGLCVKSCPGKMGTKALELDKLEIRENEQKIYDYLSKNIKEKPQKIENLKTIQFKNPKFQFHGACAGCGETSYIKILTQMFGDNLLIANATGCSSIYGGSLPSTPYTIPWANSLFEDNAEFGYGILNATNFKRNKIKEIMENNLNNENKELFDKWLNNYDNYEKTLEVYENLNYDTCPKELTDLKEYITKRIVYTIGGDGWAYDIGFGGIDHVLSTNDNVNILVLDTQIYSNTGGQSSKSSQIGSIASFTTNGKHNAKKDLARIALSYPHAYVAQVSLGANPNQLIKVFKEATNYNGPSIIIAYAPCISHGIKGGMSNTIEMEKLATSSGYFPIFHYNPTEQKFYLDSKNVDFDKYDEFLQSQTRYNMLEKINPNEAQELLKQNKENAIKRYEYYKSLEETTEM